MPLPARLARFNRAVTNKLARPVVSRLGGFAVLAHTGRRTGRVYQTPLNAWRQGSLVVVPLTYGAKVDWLRNATAAESSVMVMRGERLLVGRPEPIPRDEGLAVVPGWVGRILRILGVEEFIGFPLIG